MNLDPRSVVENTGIGMVIESPDIAVDMNEWIDREIDNMAFWLALETDRSGNEILLWRRSVDGIDQRYKTEPNTGYWRRFGVGFLRLLPIEWLL